MQVRIFHIPFDIHRVGVFYCREYAGTLAHIEELKKSDPATARLEQDWVAWRQAPNREATLAYAQALGLPRDPARARTHLVVKEMVHVPSSRDARHKFRVGRAGVFRVADVAWMIEGCMGLKEGEGEAWVRAEVEGALGRVRKSNLPVISLSTNENKDVWFVVGESSLVPFAVWSGKADADAVLL